MDTEIKPPAAAPSLGRPEEVVHLYCCWADVGLCGVLLWGDDLGRRSDRAIECLDCVVADEERTPCGARFCWLRRWWRRRRRS
jgi:hypothetical protein